jgi:ethanolamine ammonia-lyase small subunit
MKEPWQHLRQFTQARIAQGRSGHAQTTAALLDFQLAHAQARDAVHQPWDIDAFEASITALNLQPLRLSTKVLDRMHYLKRPDAGRVLADTSREAILSLAVEESDMVLIFSNGLSSIAMQSHGLALLTAILDAFRHKLDAQTCRLAPICLIPDARVAVSDEIGFLLKAKLGIIILGERPGLSVADSLGIYMSYNPNSLNTDAERNCISNVRSPEGLSYQAAASKLLYLCEQALHNKLSGVGLKDDMPGFIYQSSLGHDPK